MGSVMGCTNNICSEDTSNKRASIDIKNKKIKGNKNEKKEEKSRKDSLHKKKKEDDSHLGLFDMDLSLKAEDFENDDDEENEIINVKWSYCDKNYLEMKYKKDDKLYKVLNELLKIYEGNSKIKIELDFDPINL